MKCRDFPGGPLVKTSPYNAGGVGLVPDQGSKIPYASRLKTQDIEQKQYCNKFRKNFKNGPCQKKKKEEEKILTMRIEIGLWQCCQRK